MIARKSNIERVVNEETRACKEYILLDYRKIVKIVRQLSRKLNLTNLVDELLAVTRL